MSLLNFELLRSLVFGICVGVVVFFNIERALNFLYDRSIGTRKEVMELIDRLYLEVDKERFTMTILICSVGLGALAFLALWPNIIAGLIFGTAITLAGWTLPRSFLLGMWERRCNRVVDQMVDGMTILANGIKSGLTVAQGMERVVSNMKGPLPQEFNIILNKMRLGMALEEALNEFSDRIPRKDVQMFTTAVNILKETGGNMAETFSTINHTVRERQKVEKKIEALTTQGIWQARIISSIPLLLLGLFLVIDPKMVMPLFTTTLGWFILGLMVGLIAIGGVMMSKIVTIKV